MAFLKTALEMARTAVYSLHKSSTRDVSSNHFTSKFMTAFYGFAVNANYQGISSKFFKHLALRN